MAADKLPEYLNEALTALSSHGYQSAKNARAAIRRYVKERVAAEREACAKIADGPPLDGYDGGASCEAVASAIRAREVK